MTWICTATRWTTGPTTVAVRSHSVTGFSRSVVGTISLDGEVAARPSFSRSDLAPFSGPPRVSRSARHYAVARFLVLTLIEPKHVEVDQNECEQPQLGVTEIDERLYIVDHRSIKLPFRRCPISGLGLKQSTQHFREISPLGEDTAMSHHSGVTLRAGEPFGFALRRRMAASCGHAPSSAASAQVPTARRERGRLG